MKAIGRDELHMVVRVDWFTNGSGGKELRWGRSEPSWALIACACLCNGEHRWIGYQTNVVRIGRIDEGTMGAEGVRHQGQIDRWINR